MNKIIVISGFCAVGKDTIANELREKGYNFVVSHSTRPMRDGECEANPYHFINKEEMLSMKDNDELVEIREYNTLVDNIPDTWYYAVHRDAIKDDESYVVVLDRLGTSEFKEYYGNRVLSIFIDANDDIRKARSKTRGDFNESEWQRRLEDDRSQFNADDFLSVYDYVVKNETDDYHNCLDEIVSIIKDDELTNSSYNIRDVVRDKILNSKYDGLYHPYNTCECVGDMPCSNQSIHECEFGYFQEMTEEQKEIHPFVIGSKNDAR